MLNTSKYDKYKSDPDPLVSSLAKSHAVAVEAGETSVANIIQESIDKLIDPAYGMYSCLNESRAMIDELRYHHAPSLSNIKTSPTSASNFGANVDEFLVNLSSKLMKSYIEFSDEKGW